MRPEDADRELAQMADSSIGRTRSRQVLGTMTDFAWLLEAELEHSHSLLDVSCRLARAPCSPIGMGSPDRFTLELLSRPEFSLVH